MSKRRLSHRADLDPGDPGDPGADPIHGPGTENGPGGTLDGPVGVFGASLGGLLVPLGDLFQSPTNARAHDPKVDIPVLAGSLRRYGQQKPIVARRSGEVIAGNGTMMAAQDLGWTHLAVSWFDGTDEEAQGYALVDNRSGELSDWNWPELARQLAEAREREGEGVITELGWTLEQVAPLLAAQWQPPAAEETMPGEDMGYHSVRFTKAQWNLIAGAVDRVRDTEGDPDIKDDRAIELIVADYLAGPDPTPLEEDVFPPEA